MENNIKFYIKQLSISLWVVLISTTLFCQNINRNKIGFTSENDSYLFISQDQYYTNGFKINYFHFLNNINNTKKIISLKLSHEIYNGFTGDIDSIIYHDRPFSGYVDLKFGYQQISNKNNSLFINFEIGYLGYKTKAKEIQEYIHNTLGLYQINGWQHQLKETYTFNINTSYEFEIIKNNTKNSFQFTSTLNYGTRKSNASIGIRIIHNLNNNKLNLKNCNLNNFNVGEKNTSNLFVYIQPKISYFHHDITITGGYKDLNNPIIVDITPFRFELISGLQLQKNSFCFKIEYHYTTKETKHYLNTGHTYGSINVSKLF